MPGKESFPVALVLGWDFEVLSTPEIRKTNIFHPGHYTFQPVSYVWPIESSPLVQGKPFSMAVPVWISWTPFHITFVIVMVGVGEYAWEWEYEFFEFLSKGLTMLNIYFKTFNFRMVLDLRKSCKNSTENAHLSLSQFPLSLTFYMTRGTLVTMKGPTLVRYYQLNSTLYLNSTNFFPNDLFCSRVHVTFSCHAP